MANEREELLDASLELLTSKKVASKALKEVTKKVLENPGTTKEAWQLIRKVHAKMGKGWSGDDPLSLDEGVDKKDLFSTLLIRFINIVTAFEQFNISDKLLPYFKALESHGIRITINATDWEHADVNADQVQEYLDSAKNWLDTIDQYNETLKTEHAPKSEELNFTAAQDYGKVLSLYNRKLGGKDIDDSVQDILTRNELLDTAVNLIQDLQLD